jgi:hypothetical protein
VLASAFMGSLQATRYLNKLTLEVVYDVRD